jgi:hypothetical protein
MLFLIRGPTEPRNTALGVLPAHRAQAFPEGGRRTSEEPRANLGPTVDEEWDSGSEWESLDWGESGGKPVVALSLAATYDTGPWYNACRSGHRRATTTLAHARWVPCSDYHELTLESITI